MSKPGFEPITICTLSHNAYEADALTLSYSPISYEE